MTPAPPGAMFDVGDVMLHAIVSGEGGPPVVMEAATWDLALTWSKVQPEVAMLTTTVAYDRAGLGWSETSRAPRTASPMVDELRGLLRAAELRPPYVMVGHSFGGLVSRLFAFRYPDEVVGMVLVDAAHEDQLQRFPPEVREAQPTLYAMQLEHLRGIRDQLAAGAAVDPAMLGIPQGLPEDVLAGYRAVAASSPSRIETMIAELEGLEVSQDEIRADADAGLGDIPLMVISHGEPAPLPPIVRGGPDVGDAYEASWQGMQEDLSRLSSRGSRIVADGSMHMIHHDRPELVVGAIRDVIDEVRRREDDHG
jgi:pimeloyl-ACP methyl ester carboxylesterase